MLDNVPIYPNSVDVTPPAPIFTASIPELSSESVMDVCLFVAEYLALSWSCMFDDIVERNSKSVVVIEDTEI